MAKHAGPKLPLIVKNLFPMLNSVYDNQRVTTTAFFAEVSGAGPPCLAPCARIALADPSLFACARVQHGAGLVPYPCGDQSEGAGVNTVACQRGCVQQSCFPVPLLKGMAEKCLWESSS